MIEFNGFLTGVSQKFFCKQIVKIQQKCMACALIIGFILLPVIFQMLYGDIIEILPKIIIAEIILFIIAILLPNIQTKKEKERITPQKIYIDKDKIVSKSNAMVDTRFIQDVKEVKDYGEFYYFVFKAYSYRFVCQKDLLTHGSLEEFENLFAGKIKKM